MPLTSLINRQMTKDDENWEKYVLRVGMKFIIIIPGISPAGKFNQIFDPVCQLFLFASMC